MYANWVKQRLREGRPAIGVNATLGSPLVAELLAVVGFDFVLIDNQHGAWSVETSFPAFRSVYLGKAIPMARALENNFGAIGKLLDCGAMGVVVPLVESAEGAQAAVQAVRYPPLGRRSVGRFGTGFLGVDDTGSWNDEVFLAVQIETKAAVDRVGEILTVDGVDGCWIGPADLANSMGVDTATPAGFAACEKAILSVLDVCLKAGRIPGIAASTNNARLRLEQGFLFVTAGTDREMLTQQSKTIIGDSGRGT